MPILRELARLNRVLAYASGYVLVALTLLIVFEIFARRFFGFSVQGVDEIGGYVVATTGAFSFAYGLVEKAHTRIDILLGRLPERGNALLNVVAYLVVAGAAGFMAYYAWQTLAESLLFSSRSATPLETPIWIPQSIWFAGLAVFAVNALALAVHALATLFSDYRKVNRNYGPSTSTEQVDRELGLAAKRLSAQQHD